MLSDTNSLPSAVPECVTESFVSQEQLRLQECRARLRHLTAVREGRYKMLSAAGEEAQQAVRERLAARALAYSSVVAQLEAGYPQMEMKLRNMKALLQNFME